MAVRRHIAEGVRNHHGLGHRGGARGQQDLPDIVAMNAHLGLGFRRAGDEVTKAHSARGRRRRAVIARHRRYPGIDERRAFIRPKVGIHQGHPRVNMPQHVFDNVRRHHRVDRHRHQPGLRNPQLAEVGLHRVLAEHRHPIAALKTQRQQRVRQLIGNAVRLPVSHARKQGVVDGVCGGAERDLVRLAPGHAFQQVANRNAIPAIISASAKEIFYVERHRAIPVRIGERSHQGRVTRTEAVVPATIARWRVGRQGGVVKSGTGIKFVRGFRDRHRLRSRLSGQASTSGMNSGTGIDFLNSGTGIDFFGIDFFGIDFFQLLNCVLAANSRQPS